MLYLYCQELHRKREQKRQDTERKAAEEISFLQASGKVTRTPAHKSNIKKKPRGAESSALLRKSNSDSDTNDDNRSTGNKTGRSTARKVQDLFQVGTGQSWLQLTGINFVVEFHSVFSHDQVLQ